MSVPFGWLERAIRHQVTARQVLTGNITPASGPRTLDLTQAAHTSICAWVASGRIGSLLRTARGARWGPPCTCSQASPARWRSFAGSRTPWTPPGDTSFARTRTIDASATKSWARNPFLVWRTSPDSSRRCATPSRLGSPSPSTVAVGSSERCSPCSSRTSARSSTPCGKICADPRVRRCTTTSFWSNPSSRSF